MARPRGRAVGCRAHSRGVYRDSCVLTKVLVLIAVSATTYKTFAPGELLTVAEVAERLRVVPATVYRKVERGELEAVAIGRGSRPHIRITAESLRALVSPRETIG